MSNEGTFKVEGYINKGAKTATPQVDALPGMTTLGLAVAESNAKHATAAEFPGIAHVVAQDAAAELARLRAENAALKAKPRQDAGALRLKVGEKGGLSVYGLGRFPVTLYREQWERLLEPTQVDAILRFLDENADALKVKGA